MQIDGYIRVSRVGGREGESFISPDVQRDAIRRWAQAQNATILAEHIDLDQSGRKRDRPGLTAILDRIEAGQSEGVVVAKLDRFGRSLIDALAAIKRIEAAGARFVSVAEQFDTSTAVGKLVLRIMFSLAEFELDRVADQWLTAQARAVERGIHIASASPTGYQRGEGGRLVPNEHGPAIGEAFRMRARGANWREVGRFLEGRGVVGPYGGEGWGNKATKRMLHNPVYLGEARSGQFRNAHAHPPLIDRATFEAVQEAPQTVSRGEGALLSGLLRCAGCGFALKADHMRDRDGSRLRLYRCRGEHGMGRCEARASVLGRVIEPTVEAWFLDWLGRVAVSGAALSAERDEALSRLLAAEGELAFFRDDVEVRQLVGREGYVAGLRSRTEAVEQARTMLAAIPVSDLPSRAMVEEIWPELTLAERRRLLAAGIDVIWLRAGRNLALADRLAIFGHGTWTTRLPGQGLGRNSPRTLLWDRLPEGARIALAHDLRKGEGN